MANTYVWKCYACGQEVFYQDGQTLIKCKCCGSVFDVRKQEQRILSISPNTDDEKNIESQLFLGTKSKPEPMPAPIPEPERTIQELMEKGKSWLRLKRFDDVKEACDRVFQQGENISNSTIILLSLCADNQISSIDKLPRRIPNLQDNDQFILAEEHVSSQEEREVISDIKEACKQIKARKRSLIMSLLLTLFVCAALVALYFAEPYADETKRDTHIEIILIGGAVVILIFSIIQFYMTYTNRIKADVTERLLGLFHLFICVFAIVGVFCVENDTWDGWILGRWAYYYKYYSFHLYEIYALVIAIFLSALSVLWLIIPKNKAKSDCKYGNT